MLKNKRECIFCISLLVISLLLAGCAVLEKTPAVIPVEQTAIKESSIETTGTGAVNNLVYVLRGSIGKIDLSLNPELKKYLSEISREYFCSPVCPPESQLQLSFLDEKKQKDYLLDLVNKIKSITSNKDDQLRIAVSLVQRIPYDSEKANAFSGYGEYERNPRNRYPYEVVYDNKGICEEKSRLLAFLLREIGYDAVLFEYKFENHMTVGIKCSDQFSYKKGYCLIETTHPSIITEKPYLVGADGNVIGLESEPLIVQISKGNSFDASEDYNDNLEWSRLKSIPVIGQEDYNSLVNLRKKYGI